MTPRLPFPSVDIGGAKWIVVAVVGLVAFPSVYAFTVNPYNNPYAGDLPPYNLYERTWTLDTVNKVAAFIESHTSAQDMIFTADTVFAAAAGRRVALDLIYPNFYSQPGLNSPFSYDPYGLFPSTPEIVQSLESQRTPLAVVGFRTEDLFGAHPELQRYVLARYSKLYSVGTEGHLDYVEVLGRTSLSPPVDFLDCFSGNLSDYSVVQGTWNVSYGALASTWGSPVGSSRAIIVARNISSNILALQTSLRTTGEGGIVFGYQNPGSYYLLRLIKSPDITGGMLIGVRNYSESILWESSFGIESAVWYNVSVTVIGDHIWGAAGPATFEVRSAAGFPPGQVGLSSNYGAEFDFILATNQVDYLTGLATQGAC